MHSQTDYTPERIPEYHIAAAAARREQALAVRNALGSLAAWVRRQVPGAVAALTTARLAPVSEATSGPVPTPRLCETR